MAKLLSIDRESLRRRLVQELAAGTFTDLLFELHYVTDKKTGAKSANVQLVPARMAEDNERPARSEDCPELLYTLMQACWVPEMSDRPTAAKARQAMALLIGNQSRLMLSECLGAWSRLRGELKKERVFERQTMALLIGNQCRLMLSQVFSAWSRLPRRLAL